MLVYSTAPLPRRRDEAQIAAFLAGHLEFLLFDLSGCGFGRPGEANRAPDPRFPRRNIPRRIWLPMAARRYGEAAKKAADAGCRASQRVKPPRR